MLHKIIYIYLLISVLFGISPLCAQKKQASGKPIPASQQALLNYIETLKNDSDLKVASWSVLIVDCDTKKTIASYRSSVNLIPASILKLVTTGMGALVFNNNHKFVTKLAYQGSIDTDSVLQGNLYIIGGGDPTFGSDQFKGTSADSIFGYFTQSLKTAGIRAVNGKLIADASLFDDIEIHDTWEWGDMGNYYGAGTSALSFCENMFGIAIKPSLTVNQSATLGLSNPTLPRTTVIRNMVTTSPKDSSVTANLFASPMLNEYWIRGTVPLGKDSIVAKGAIQKPAMVCITGFDEFLNQNGISTLHQFEVKTDTIRPDLTAVIAEWLSPNYSEIAENTNRYSNNVFAETIFKHIAVRNSQNKQGSYKTGATEVVKLLDEKKVTIKTININDGSGLSRHNLISADFMCQFLVMMHATYPNFSKLIPMPGEKGTLQTFMLAYPNSRNKVRLKSGSMTGVLNYAGYIKGKNGNTLCITVMANNFTCKVSQIRPKLEKLVYLTTESE